MATRHVPTGVTGLLAASGLTLALLAAHTTPHGYRAGPQPVVSYHLGSAQPGPLPTLAATAPTHAQQSGSEMDVPVLVVAYLVVATIAVLLVLALYRRLRELRGRHRQGARLEAEAADWNGEIELATLLDEAVADGLVELERRPVREAIIQCWIRMQATADDAGLPGRASDTPRDFVHRVLAASTVRAQPLDTLARLYREARFSTHAMSDTDRAAARDALESIQAQLAVRSNA